MTAINIVAQPKFGCIHIATDAAIYETGIGVTSFSAKVFPIPHLSAVITGVGARNPIFAFASVLSMTTAAENTSFDAMIAAAPAVLPALAQSCEWPLGSQINIAGLSETRGPESYVFRIGDDLPVTVTRDEAEASPYWGAPGQLFLLPNEISTPGAAFSDIIASDYEGIDVDDDPEIVIWQMRKLLELQRQLAWSISHGAVGGFGQITTISADGITQRMLQRWPDAAGAGDIFPAPIDWKQWHLDNPKPGSMSRLKRSIFERKAAKRTMPLHLVQ